MFSIVFSISLFCVWECRPVHVYLFVIAHNTVGAETALFLYNHRNLAEWRLKASWVPSKSTANPRGPEIYNDYIYLNNI